MLVLSGGLAVGGVVVVVEPGLVASSGGGWGGVGRWSIDTPV
jgi:hypothetical protein